MTSGPTPSDPDLELELVPTAALTTGPSGAGAGAGPGPRTATGAGAGPGAGRGEELREMATVGNAPAKGISSPTNGNVTERSPLLPPPRAVHVTKHSPPPPSRAFEFANGEPTCGDRATPDGDGMLAPIFVDMPNSLPAGAVAPRNNLNYGTALPPLGSDRGHVHHHSILRANSARTLVPHRTIRKSASVEFRLAHEDESRQSDRMARRPSLGREFPRRLTSEEKVELYRVRPDLEIGPVPYFQEQIEEMKRQSQRRMLFAIFGGMFSMLLLMMVYYLLTKKYKKKLGVAVKQHNHDLGMLQWD